MTITLKYLRFAKWSDFLRNARKYSSSTVAKTENDFKFIPRRSLLYVPGSDEKKLIKITNLNADCIVMDCEDGVAVSKKEEARSIIHKFLQRKDEFFKGKDCSVRVNGIESEFFFADMQKVLEGPILPSTILLPKVECVDHIKQFSDTLNSRLKTFSPPLAKLRLVIYVESAKGLLGLSSLCKAAVNLSEKSPFVLDGVVFGSDDYCADIGATRTSASKETLFARQWTVAVAKSFGLQAIDVVYIDYKDLKGLKEQSEEGAQFGFTGKQIIHPSQIDIVQTAFSPYEAKLDWARRLVDAFHQHQAEGKGAFTFEGSMIDRPLLLQAENTLRTAKNDS